MNKKIIYDKKLKKKDFNKQQLKNNKIKYSGKRALTKNQK